MAKKKATTKLTGDELRSKLAERAHRMPWRQFSDSLSPDEHRELTFFGGSAVDFWRTYNADETQRRQTMEQPKKSHAKIKREIDEILARKPAALFPPETSDEMSWKSTKPWLSNWRVDTRATTDPAAVGSRWEVVSGSPNNPWVSGAEARSLYSRLVTRGYKRVRLVQRHPRDAHLERVVVSTENAFLES